jgi:hypothetical protein
MLKNHNRYGNLLKEQSTAGTIGTTCLSVSALTNQVTGTCAVNPLSTYSYDANGNMLKDGANTLTYDAENRSSYLGLRWKGGTLWIAIVIVVTSRPSLERSFGKNQVWFPFVIFAATTFSVLVNRFRPRREQTKYWIVALGAFFLHMAFFVLFIRYVRSLAPVDYIVYGPLDWFTVGLILYSAGRIRGAGTHS